SGEEAQLNTRNTFAKKPVWYRFKRRVPADLFMSRGVGERHYCILNEADAVSSGTFSEIFLLNPEHRKGLWGFLNSSISWLLLELSGRTQMGGGLLKIDPTDLRQMKVLDPRETSAE